MTKPVILTGLRANNDLHIGNYFGALLPIINMALSHIDEYEINLFVPDLHSFTTPIDHSSLYKQTLNNLRIYVASGLPIDNEFINIYRQSFIPAHSELTWILDCFSNFGEIARMTQFKEKSRQQNEILLQENSNKKSELNGIKTNEVNKFIEDLKTFEDNFKNNPDLLGKYRRVEIEALEYSKGAIHDHLKTLEDYKAVIDEAILTFQSSIGLFNYPILMAADILLYNAIYIPVGEDQTQHLEFTRDIATRMNNRFGELFSIPKTVKEQNEFFGKAQGLRIKDLFEPTKKMSKSDTSDKGIIFLNDAPEKAVKKVMSATTDSVGAIHFDIEKQPGITNLLQLLALFTNKNQLEINAQWEGNENYGELKSAVAQEVRIFLIDFQNKLAKVDDQLMINKILKDEEKINNYANSTLLKVQKAVGLRQ